MSNSGIVGGLARVSIPSGMRKTIQNIKEITGNHGEDEIYAMLKECSMDPNETTQKLLSQGSFLYLSFCFFFFFKWSSLCMYLAVTLLNEMGLILIFFVICLWVLSI